MRVTIIDLDWYNKVSFLPNVKCMKLSSYHQQLGDLVSFPQNEYELLLDYDKMYIIRESMDGTIPKKLPLRSEKVYLMGKFFKKYYSRYAEDEFTDVIAACRPDYLLYPLKEENKMTKANIVQFYNGDKRLPKLQNFKNAYTKNQYTLVVDDGFWARDKKDIIECVKVLKSCQNIVFSKEISLKSIIYDSELKNLFFSMNFKEGSMIKFVNDCEVGKEQDIMDFLKEYQEKFTTQRIPPIYFNSLTMDHNADHTLAIKDFERCLDIIYRAKQQQVKIYIRAPRRADTPFWYFFEELEAWCKYRPRDSFVEHMFYVNQVVYKAPVELIMQNKLQWNTVQSQMFEELYRKYPDLINKYAYLRWGDEEFTRMDLDKIIYRR